MNEAIAKAEDRSAPNLFERRVLELERLLIDFAVGPRGIRGNGVYENDAVFAVRVKRESRRILGF